MGKMETITSLNVTTKLEIKILYCLITKARDKRSLIWRNS